MRYTGPKWRRARRLGFSLLGTGEEFNGHTLKKGDKRDYAPGQHGAEKKKLSEYGKQLNEKQKLRDLYGVNERQFRRLFLMARKSKEINTSLLMEKQLIFLPTFATLTMLSLSKKIAKI